jgi:hypothetical protein
VALAHILVAVGESVKFRVVADDDSVRVSVFWVAIGNGLKCSVFSFQLEIPVFRLFELLTSSSRLLASIDVPAAAFRLLACPQKTVPFCAILCQTVPAPLFLGHK